MSPNNNPKRMKYDHAAFLLAIVYFSKCQFIQEDLICLSQGSFLNSISIPLRLKDTGVCITVFSLLSVFIYCTIT